MSDQAYPLHWPAGWPRTPVPLANKKFGDRTVSQAVQGLMDELGRLDATDAVISSNVTMMHAEPKDRGVCVYFRIKGKAYALPCDKWRSVTDNLIALTKHIEALRGQERWGVGTVERAFAGYMAIEDGRKTWRQVFGYAPAEIPAPGDFSARFRDLAIKCHPDHGGSADRMAQLNQARDEAKKELGIS